MYRLSTVDPKVKAIMTNGYVDEPVISNFADFGVQATPVKPFTFKVLTNTVNAGLNTPGSDGKTSKGEGQ